MQYNTNYFLPIGSKGTRTAGAVEAWNLIVKRRDHLKHRLRPDIFVQEHESYLTGRQKSYIDSISTKNKINVRMYSYNLMHIYINYSY